MYLLYYTCTEKLRLSSRSCRSVFPFTTLVLQSCDFRAGAAKVHFLYYACAEKLRLSAKVHFLCCTCAAKLRLSSRICQSVFSGAIPVLKSCDFRAGAAKVHVLYYTFTEKLRLSSRSCQSALTCAEKLRLSSRSCQSVVPVLHLYWKVATFEPELPKCAAFTIPVLKSCDFRAGAAKV